MVTKRKNDQWCIGVLELLDTPTSWVLKQQKFVSQLRGLEVWEQGVTELFLLAASSGLLASFAVSHLRLHLHMVFPLCAYLCPNFSF